MKKLKIKCKLHKKDEILNVKLKVKNVYAMGFTARNQEAMLRNLKSLKSLNVKIPKRIPSVYPLIKNIIDLSDEIEVVSNDTCAEVEFLIIIQNEDIYIGIGSDHSDKVLESESISKSKQICPKHFHTELWDYKDVKNHWDELEIGSYYYKDGEKIVFQKGFVKDMLHPDTVIDELKNRYDDINKIIVYSGSIANLTGFIYGEKFEYYLNDPVLNRKLKTNYKINVIDDLKEEL